MNEQLQAQLIEILKDLRAGASPAWQELVHQRSMYYGTISLVAILGSLILFFLGPYLIRKANRLDDMGQGDNACMIGIAGVLSIILCAIFACVCLFNLPTCIAPLGTLLNKVTG